MHIKSLTNIIDTEESSTIEWKKSLSEIKEVIETVCVFANAEGGKVYLGILGDGRLAGIQLGKDTIENLTNHISQHTDPKVHPKITVRKINGKEIIIIEVKKSHD